MPSLIPSLVPFAERRRPSIIHVVEPNSFDPSTEISEALARVPLQTGQYALASVADYNALMLAGVSDQWFLHSNGQRHSYVRTTMVGHGDTLFMVARLIVGGEYGTRVRYQDGNSLNLRRSNLIVRDGFSKGHEANALAEAADPNGTGF